MKVGESYVRDSWEKQAFDRAAVVGMAAVGIVGLPLGAALSCAASRVWNPIFRQPRHGLNGEYFDVTKYRTIHPGRTADDYVSYGTYDPRATRLGNLVRRSHLDEMPQIWDILRGKMSVVGPRPLPNANLKQYRDNVPDLYDEWYEVACLPLKPGLFCLSGLYRCRFPQHSDEAYRISMMGDLWYARNASLLVDAQIMADTLPYMLGSQTGLTGLPTIEEIMGRGEELLVTPQ